MALRPGRSWPLPLAAALLAAPLAAQNSFLIPSRDIRGNPMASTQGDFQDLVSYWINGPTWPGPMRIQHLWPVTDIPVPGAVLNGMGFRRSHAITSMNPQATASITVRLSVGPNTVPGRSVTFSANHGANVVTVFQGVLNLPQLAAAAGVPPITVRLPFTTPFTYISVNGNTLVAEFAVASYTPTSTNATWYLDAVRDGAGTYVAQVANAGCLFSNGRYTRLSGIGVPRTGGSLYTTFSGQGGTLPTGLPALGFLGFVGSGGNWNGLTLPFDLAPLGAPSCSLGVGLTIFYPLAESVAPGSYSGTLPVPNDPSLADLNVFTQALWLEPGANALGVVPGISHRWTIGSGRVPEGAKLYQYHVSGNVSPNPTDGYSTPVATIAEFYY